MRYHELNEQAQARAMEEYKKSSYSYWVDNPTPENIESDMLYFTEEGEILGEYRICSICGEVMICGYCYEGGEKYYCSDECLHHDFTDEEWEEVVYNSDSYWTEWY